MTVSPLRQTKSAPHEELYALFDCADFFYRTPTPVLLDDGAINALIDERTRFLMYRSELAGLWSFRSLTPQNWNFSQFSGFYHVDYRLHSKLPAESWVDGFEGILSYLKTRSDVVRIALHVAEFDRLGKRMAKAMGFTREGVLGDTVTLAGRSWGTAIYARTWRPS